MLATTPFLTIIKIKDQQGRVVGEKEVVTYPGLLSKAHDESLSRVETTLLQIPDAGNGETAIVKATVQTTKGVFEGLGDANPTNVPSRIVPHLIRMAETRAKARALRDAVNIGVVSFEELDGDGLMSGPDDLGSGDQRTSTSMRPAAGRTNGQRIPSNGRSSVESRGPGNGSRQMSAPASRPSRASNGRSQSQPDPMSESQRRYIYRLVASRGIAPDQTEAFLADHFGVENLSGLSRFAATKLIDELLATAGGEVASRGTGQR